jgi:hypothetical protein
MPALPGTTQYVAKRASDIRIGDHVLNRGDVKSASQTGVFTTITYHEIVYSFASGRGHLTTKEFTVHEASLVAVEV